MINEFYIKITTGILVVIFFIIRSRFTVHYKKFTYNFLVKWIVLLFLGFFYYGGFFDRFNIGFNFGIRVFGIILVLIGFWLFIYAHNHLSINWSPIIEKKFNKSRYLVASGPYRYLRHPIYTASIFCLIGFFFFTTNYLLLGIPFLILVLFYSYKIKKEEEELIRNFGKRYINYMKSTGGLIPKLR